MSDAFACCVFGGARRPSSPRAIMKQRRLNGVGLSPTKEARRPLTPHRELARSLALEHAREQRRAREARRGSPHGSLSCICATVDERVGSPAPPPPHPHSSKMLSTTLTVSSGAGSAPLSPSAAARRKRSAPAPVPLGAIPCDNFECGHEGIMDDNWHTARLGQRVFRFCCQECWTSWLDNPGHLGSWSSPLLSYQSSPSLGAASPPLSLASSFGSHHGAASAALGYGSSPGGGSSGPAGFLMLGGRAAEAGSSATPLPAATLGGGLGGGGDVPLRPLQPHQRRRAGSSELLDHTQTPSSFLKASFQPSHPALLGRSIYTADGSPAAGTPDNPPASILASISPLMI